MLYSFLTDEQNAVIQQSIAQYRGHATALESALGAVVIGHNYGWRVLKLVHSPATYRKYENILSVKFQDLCPERGPLSNKSRGLAIADKLNSFWAVATGKKKIEDKSELGDEKEIERDLLNVEQP